MGYRLEVTTEPLVSTQDLAIHLAEALQGMVDAERDSVEFLRQISVENQKVTNLRFTLSQVKQYRKTNPVQTSRMDPMFEYDLDKMQEEIEECSERSKQWTEIRESCLVKVSNLKKKSAELQQELTLRRKKEA